MAEIYTVRSILGDESLQNLINQGKSQDEIISIAKAYKDEAIKSGDKDALSKMNLVSQKQGKADFFTRLGDKMDANGYETMGSIARGIDILASKAAAPIAGLVGDSDKEAQILADMKLTQSINEAKNLDKIATTARTQREYQIDSNNLLANAIGSYTKESKTYARNLVEQGENSGYTAMDRFNIGMATTANSIKYLIKSILYGEDSKEANDIKDAQKILQASRDAYEANNPDKWNVANFAGEMVTDPLNAVGIAKGFKVANTAFKKGANVAFDLAQLGAIGGMAGAIMEYGSHKEKDEQNVAGAAMIGAGAGVALGAGFMALGVALNKIASRFGQKSTLEQNAQIAKDEAIKELEKGTPQDIDKRLQKISDDIEEAFSTDENAENIARLLGQEYDDNINKAIKESQEVSTQVDSSVAKFANDNPNSSASDIEIYINKTYAPSESEKELTRIINDDKPVTPRMAGYRVLGVLQKTMEYKTRFDRDTIIKRFKNHGFSDELANVFADAYIADDIGVARRYLDSKVASNRQKSVEDGRNEWLENTTKSNKAKTPKNQDEILKEISSDKTQFKLIDDSDMTPELKSRLENDGYTLEREPESGVWEVSKAISDEEIKGSDEALENAVVKGDKLDILDKSKPFRKVDKEDLTADVMNEVIENNIKIWVDNANDEISKIVNIKNPKMVMQGDSIKHILNRHGANSVNVKNGEPEVTIEDIINHSDIVNNADKRTIGVSNNAKALISGKQINGHYVVVETIGNKKGELNLKTMYKVKGKIEDNEIFKKSAVLDHRKDGGKAIVSSTSNPLDKTSDASNITSKTIPNQSIKEAETTAKEPTQPQPNTNSRLEKIKKFVEGKTNKALDSDIKVYNQLYRYVLDDFAKAHPDELNLPKYASEMANYITKEFLVKHDKEIKEIITQKTSGENRQIVLNAFENLKQNFDELRSVGIGDLRKPTAKDIKDKIAEIEIKSMSDKELVTQFQKLKDSKARVNENLYKYLENEIKQREKKLYPFINSDKKDYSYDLEKQLKNRGLMGLKDSELENIAKERNSVLYLPSYIRENIEQELNIKPIKEFGTNYAEFYHDGKGAIHKLLTERQGQVAGAFYKDGKDITLVWGVEGTGHSDGYGIAKIAKYHPEALDKMEEMLKMPIIAQSENRIKLSDGKYFMSIRKDFNGEKQNWILTAFEKEESKSVSGRRTNLSATQSASEKTTSQNTHTMNSTPKEIKSQGLNLSRAERRAMGIEEPKGKTLVIDEKAVKSDVREFGRLADQVGLGFKSAKEAKAVMDKCDKSKFDCGS